MKLSTMLVAALALALAGCGGKKKEPAHPQDKTPPADTAATKPPEKAEKEPAPTPAPPPAPPKVFKASAALVPVKGQKFKPTTVRFTQTDGDPTSQVTSAGFDGLKVGKYHLVVHAGADCGTNGAKAGAALGTAPMDFAAAKDGSNIDLSGIPVALEGDQTITGHVLAMHDDKGGKAGKILACGPIVPLDAAD